MTDPFDQLIKSRFIEMFGNIRFGTQKYPLKTMQEISDEIIAGGDKPLDLSPIQTESHPYPVFANATENAGLMGFSSNYRISSEAVTISARGAIIGYTQVRPPKFTPVVRLITIIPKESINCYFLKIMLDQLDLKPSGSGQPQLIVPDLKKYPVICPPKQIQDDFVAFLQQVNKSKLLYKQLSPKFDNLIKSRFIEMFGSNKYPKKMIKDLVVQDVETIFIDHPEVERFVTLSSHGRGAKQRIIKDGKTPVKFNAYRIKAGQFIYSRIDARNGAFALVPEDLDGAVVSKDFPIFDIKIQLVLPKYFIYAVLQDSFVAQIQNDSFGATNRQRVKEEVFGKYTIPWPPIEKQKAFV